MNLTQNIQTLMINSVLNADDVKASTVHYKAIAFPKMLAALESHKVDAISAVEPFVTTAEQKAGAVPIVDQCSGPDSNLPLSGYIATSAWAQQNPEAVRRFQQAMAQAQEIADSDRAAVEKTLLTYVPGLTPEQAATITLEQFPTSLDSVQLNRVSDLMQEAGLPHVRGKRAHKRVRRVAASCTCKYPANNNTARSQRLIAEGDVRYLAAPTIKESHEIQSQVAGARRRPGRGGDSHLRVQFEQFHRRAEQHPPPLPGRSAPRQAPRQAPVPPR